MKPFFKQNKNTKKVFEETKKNLSDKNYLLVLDDSDWGGISISGNRKGLAQNLALGAFTDNSLLIILMESTLNGLRSKHNLYEDLKKNDVDIKAVKEALKSILEKLGE